jgi:hypothetical protein
MPIYENAVKLSVSCNRLDVIFFLFVNLIKNIINAEGGKRGQGQRESTQFPTLSLLGSLLGSIGSEEGLLLLISGLFLLTVAGTSSLRKLGPVPTTGVAKFSGLGRVLFS